VRWLVTGGAGFIGSHVADSLIDSDHQVTALDNVSTGSRDNIAHLLDNPAFSLVEGTIMDAGLVDRLAAEHDVIVHLAAAVGVKLIVDKPLESLLTNIRGTENVLDAAARYGRRTLITSTSEIYGKNAHGPVGEDADRILGSPFVARWSYSTSKAVDEILAHAYWEDRGLETIVVRLFNCVGPRQTGEFGMVVPTFVRQALRGEPLTVHGDGQQQRSFCHVYDTVTALLEVLETPEAAGGVFNIGALNEITMEQLAKETIARTDSTSEIRYIPYEQAYGSGFEDMERRLPDTTRIRRLIGWSPSRTLDEILNDVIAFERTRVEART
jgi:UDP-glucose 4-epimerase